MKKPAVPVEDIAALGGKAVTVTRRRGRQLCGVIAAGRALSDPPTVALIIHDKPKPVVVKCADIVGIEEV